MGTKGVKKLIRKIKNSCKRDPDLWTSYNDAYKNESAFLTELGKFNESYEKCLTQLKEMEEQDSGSDGYTRILEKLNQHYSAVDQRLLEKVTHLIKKQDVMHTKLTSRLHKSAGKKHRCSRAWRRCLRMVTYVVFIGAVAAEFSCTVVIALLATPLVALAIAAAIIPTLAGQHLTLSWIKESPFENQDKVIRLMQSKSMEHKKELQNTDTGIKVVRSRLDSLLEDLYSLSDGEDDLPMDAIENSLNKLNDLKEIARNCKSVILKARGEVSEELRKASTL